MKRLTKYLGVFLAGLILASPVMMALPLQNEAHASPGPYFKMLTIQGGNVSSANYTMIPITIHSGNGTDNATDYYLQGQGAFSDFRDVSFTNANGDNLSFYSENYPPLEHGGVADPIYSNTNLPTSIQYTYNSVNYTVVVWQSGTSTLDPYISQLNHSTNVWTFPIKIGASGLSGDEHGAPNIFRDNLGYFHSVFGAHGGDFQYVRSTNPNDITSWTVMPDITVSGGGTYPRWVQTPDNKLWLFYRGASGLRLTYKTSVDNGSTWSGETDLILAVAGNSIYSGNVVYDSTNQTFNVAWATYNGTTAKKQNIYEAYLKVADNNMYSMNGTNFGANITEAEANAFAKLYSSTGAFETQIPGIALDNNNVPYVISTIQDGTGYHHEWSSWNVTSSNWTPFAIIANTNWLFNEQNFRVVSSSNITAYLTTGGLSSTHPYYNRGGDITKYTFNGVTWSAGTSIMTAQNSSFPLNLPAIVQGSNESIIYTQIAPEQYNFSGLQMYYYDGTTSTPIIPKTYRVWVKVDSIPQSPSTTTIKMWYGNPAATSQSNAETTFTKYNNGITGNFTSALAGAATLTNYPVPATLQSSETNAATDAFAYGAIVTSNTSMEFIDIRNATGTDGGTSAYMFVDSANITGVIGTSGVVPVLRRFGVVVYNAELTTPRQVVVFYQDGASAYWSWNGTAWQAGFGSKVWSILSSMNIRLSITDTTLYASIVQSDKSVIGNTASIPLASVKAFANGKALVHTEMFTDIVTANTKLTDMALRPYINQEPAYLGSLPNLSTGTSNVSVNKDGVTSVNVTGIFGDIGSTPTQGWVEYKNTVNATWATTANVTYTTNGTKSITLPITLTPGETYTWKFRATSAGGTSNGTDSTFTLTLPSVSTGTVTQSGNQATLNGNVINMGVASSAYRYFEWWQNGVPVQTTPLGTSVAIGAYNSTITFDTLKEVNYRAVTQVGSVKVYGATLTFSSGTIATSGNLFWTILPMIVAAGVIIACAALFMRTLEPGLLVAGVVGGLVAYVVTVVLVNAFFR